MVISQTPVRISISGGTTDFPDYYRKFGPALVITTSINRYIYVIVKERFDNRIGVFYESSEVVDNISEIKHDLVRESAKYLSLNSGFDVSIMSDIPTKGSGLGSSSSLTVGLLHAMSVYMGDNVDNKWLAEAACEIEIDILNKPIGKQDQYIASFGGFRALTFLSRESNKKHIYTRGGEAPDDIVPSKISLPTPIKREIESNLMLFYTDQTRSADSILTEQKNNISNKMKELDSIKSLSYELYRRLSARYNYDINYIGTALSHNWNLKKELASNITNNKIEEILSLAINSGASGGKISGAGGGGFCLIFCEKDKQTSVRSALKNYYEFPFLLEDHGSRIVLNLPVTRIK